MVEVSKMNWHILGYALLCIIAPVAWGLLVYKASTIVEGRVLKKSSTKAPATGRKFSDDTLPLEYHI